MRKTYKKIIPLLFIAALVLGSGSAFAVIYSLGVSNPVVVNVNDTTQTITPSLSASLTSITIGQSVTLTAQCTGNWVNKPISFYDGATLLQTVNTDVSGVASITVTPATVAPHSYTVGP